MTLITSKSSLCDLSDPEPCKLCHRDTESFKSCEKCNNKACWSGDFYEYQGCIKDYENIGILCGPCFKNEMKKNERCTRCYYKTSFFECKCNNQKSPLFQRCGSKLCYECIDKKDECETCGEDLPTDESMNLNQITDFLYKVYSSTSIPCSFSNPHSYRGYYTELGIEMYTDKNSTVGDFISVLNSAYGETYEGYKGGNFTMGGTSRVYVAWEGTSHGSVLIGARFLKMLTGYDSKNESEEDR